MTDSVNSWWADMRRAFAAPQDAASVLDLMNREHHRRRAVQTWALVFILFGILTMYVRAVYNQAAVIHIFEQPIDTEKDVIRQQAVLLGALLSPQRIAMLCEYPMLYSFLGYTSPYTGPVVKALADLEPSVERVVMALTLLEGGLVVDTTQTNPPTVFNEVIRQIYPGNDFSPPTIIHPPSPVQAASSTISQIIPVIMQAVFFIPMIFGG